MNETTPLRLRVILVLHRLVHRCRIFACVLVEETVRSARKAGTKCMDRMRQMAVALMHDAQSLLVIQKNRCILHQLLGKCVTFGTLIKEGLVISGRMVIHC